MAMLLAPTTLDAAAKLSTEDGLKHLFPYWSPGRSIDHVHLDAG